MTAVVVWDSPLYGQVLMFGTFPLAGRADTAVIALNAWLYIFISMIGKCLREQKQVQCHMKCVLHSVSLTLLSRSPCIRASPLLGYFHWAVALLRFVLYRQGFCKALLISGMKSGWFWPSVYHFSVCNYLIEVIYHFFLFFLASLLSSLVSKKVGRNRVMKHFCMQC